MSAWSRSAGPRRAASARGPVRRAPEHRLDVGGGGGRPVDLGRPPLLGVLADGQPAGLRVDVLAGDHRRGHLVEPAPATVTTTAACSTAPGMTRPRSRSTLSRTPSSRSRPAVPVGRRRTAWGSAPRSSRFAAPTPTRRSRTMSTAVRAGGELAARRRRRRWLDQLRHLRRRLCRRHQRQRPLRHPRSRMRVRDRPAGRSWQSMRIAARRFVGLVASMTPRVVVPARWQKRGVHCGSRRCEAVRSAPPGSRCPHRDRCRAGGSPPWGPADAPGGGTRGSRRLTRTVVLPEISLPPTRRKSVIP